MIQYTQFANSSKTLADKHSPLSSKNATHKTGIPIAALDVSPYRTHAILAGRDILKTVQVSGSTCVEDNNLRSAIITYAATHSTSGGAISAKHKDQLAANDVKWSHGKFDSTVATAAANGQIVIYDINRPGIEFARLHEHVRQVHRVAFNPHQGALLLSGSQDATMRLWDLRDLDGDRSVMTCRSAHQYPGNNEGIRDLRWSPTNGVEFAAGTDNGVIQRWDFRKNRSPMLKINAHEKTCHSIDWHPDGKHLVSGGADKFVNVWDFSSTDRRKKPCWQIRAPQAVLNVRWRPPAWCADGNDPGSWQCTQVATSYDYQDPRIHIWDFRRQHLPFQEIDRYDTPPTAMLWHSESLLWSVGNAGIFTQNDIKFSTKTSGKRSANVVSVSSTGKISFFSEPRASRRKSLQDASSDFLDRHRRMNTNGEKLSGSHSATDGSLEEGSLLSSSFKNRHRKSPSTRSSKSIGGTPPSAGTGGPTLRFDETMQKEFSFGAQAAALGNVVGLFDVNAFRFLARHYSTPPTQPTTNVDESRRALVAFFKQNSILAASVNHYRLAQSWRISGLAIEKDLQLWAKRSNVNHSSPSACLKQSSTPSARIIIGETHALVQDDDRDKSKSGIGKARAKLMAPLTFDNSSNMTTPIARPVSDKPTESVVSSNIPAPEGDEILSLPEPVWREIPNQQQANPSHDLFDSYGFRSLHDIAKYDERALNESAISPKSSQSHLDDADRLPSAAEFIDIDHQINERRAAMENYRAKPRPLLTLDEPVNALRGNLLAPSLNRHDSDESFQLFSASTDSSQRASSVTGSFGSSQGSERPPTIPERWNVGTRHPRGNDRNYREAPMIHEGHNNFPSESRRSILLGALSPPSQTMVKNHHSQNLESSPLLRPSHHEPTIIHSGDIEPSGRPDISPTGLDGEHEPKRKPLDYTGEALHLEPPRPWAFTSLIEPLINYHTAKLCSSQLPAHMVLLLGSRLQDSFPHDLLISILLTYHDQLTSLSLHTQAAHLRNLAYPSYVDVSNYGSYGITPGGPWCTYCQKPSKGDKPLFCERCNHPWADCPICYGEGPTIILNGRNIEPSDSLWGWCQWCGHGGHVGCLRVWWADDAVSEGGCATAGCLHDCVAGTRREEALKRKGEAKKTGTVKGDRWVVGESRAVERARVIVGANVSNRGGIMQDQASTRGLGGGHGHGPLSLGMMGRSGSGGKKVRLLIPKEETEKPGESDGGRQVVPTSISTTSVSAP